MTPCIFVFKYECFQKTCRHFLGRRSENNFVPIYQTTQILLGCRQVLSPTYFPMYFDGENISFDVVLLYIYIYSTNFPPIIIINRIYGHQNLLSLQLVSFLVGLRTYQHPCIIHSLLIQCRDTLIIYTEPSLLTQSSLRTLKLMCEFALKVVSLCRALTLCRPAVFAGDTGFYLAPSAKARRNPFIATNLLQSLWPLSVCIVMKWVLYAVTPASITWNLQEYASSESSLCLCVDQ